MTGTDERTKRDMARRTVLLGSDLDTFRDLLEVSRKYPWLIRGNVLANELQNLVASASMVVRQLVSLDGRPMPPSVATLHQLLDLASNRNGTDDLVGPGLQEGLRLMAELPGNPTVHDFGNLPRDKVDGLLWSGDMERGRYLRGLADKLHQVPATYDVDGGDVDMLRTIADHLAPGAPRHDGTVAAR